LPHDRVIWGTLRTAGLDIWRGLTRGNDSRSTHSFHRTRPQALGAPVGQDMAGTCTTGLERFSDAPDTLTRTCTTTRVATDHELAGYVRFRSSLYARIFTVM
jgi:hypothetical protein